MLNFWSIPSIPIHLNLIRPTIISRHSSLPGNPFSTTTKLHSAKKSATHRLPCSCTWLGPCTSNPATARAAHYPTRSGGCPWGHRQTPPRWRGICWGRPHPPTLPQNSTLPPPTPATRAGSVPLFAAATSLVSNCRSPVASLRTGPSTGKRGRKGEYFISASFLSMLSTETITKCTGTTGDNYGQ